MDSLAGCGPQTQLLFSENVCKNEDLGPVRGSVCQCNSQKYAYPQNYIPGIFLRMKISQKHTWGMFLHQAIRNR